jgi:hypothetical protein
VGAGATPERASLRPLEGQGRATGQKLLTPALRHVSHPHPTRILAHGPRTRQRVCLSSVTGRRWCRRRWWRLSPLGARHRSRCPRARISQHTVSPGKDRGVGTTSSHPAHPPVDVGVLRDSRREAGDPRRGARGGVAAVRAHQVRCFFDRYRRSTRSRASLALVGPARASELRQPNPVASGRLCP